MGLPSPESKKGRGRPAGRKSFTPDVKERVILATMEAMESLGLEGVKARLISKNTGISVGSIYNLFGDLDQLIRTINGRTYDQLYEIESKALSASRAAGQSPHEQMLALARAYLDFVSVNNPLWSAVLAFNRAQTQPAPDWYAAKEKALITIIEQAIEPLPGAVDPKTRLLHARALWASIHGIVTVAVTGGFADQAKDEVWTQIRIVVNAVATALEQ